MSRRDLSLATIITPLPLLSSFCRSYSPLFSVVRHSSSNLQYQQAAHVMTTARAMTAAFGKHTGIKTVTIGWDGRGGTDHRQFPSLIRATNYVTVFRNSPDQLATDPLC